MLTYRDFTRTFKELELGSHSLIIAHASIAAFGEVAGGADTIVGALLSTCGTVIMPAFTYRTMITPLIGPPENAIDYNSTEEDNLAAEFFRPDMPVDSAMGVVAEALRRHPMATRSSHPLLSFSGVHAEEALQSQTLEEPLAPIEWLAEYDGDVLLLGVGHTVNISLHYAEKQAGRKQFLRWALTPEGVVPCPGWPGCPDGFQAIAPRLEGVIHRVPLGGSAVEVVPLRDLIHIAVSWIHEDPRALLCDRLGCERCASVRASVRVER
jgi:aminoglycoside 3-N-acetyltransferase